MTIIVRSPIDGTTQDVDDHDRGRLGRLVEMGYLVVEQKTPSPKPVKRTAAKRATKRAAKQ